MALDPFAHALEQWTTLLGASSVLVDSASLNAAQTATFPSTQNIPVILIPPHRDALRDAVVIGGRFGIPLYPISTGKNWGYGSRVPPVDGCALLDLSRLDQIIDFDEELAYVTVEPGVTQRQLHTFLHQRGSRLWMDATGSSPDCSLIGNAMERGFGHTPYGDHAAYVCGLQVLLADGTFIETGAARFPGSQTAAVSRYGVGPSFDGLFTQSNLGIVTRMTIWLMPAPASFSAFFFRCEEPDGVSALVDALRPLRLQEVLRSSIHIGNDYKVLAGLRQFPWDETGGSTPLSPGLMARFRRDLTFGAWSASGALYGTAQQVREGKRLLRRALAAVPGQLKFVDERMLRVAKRFAKPFKLFTGWDIGRTAELVEPIIGLMQGVPTAQSLGSAYWRKRIPIPTDPNPDRDRCGLLWYAPVVPATGEHALAITQLVTEIMLRHTLEPLLSLTLISARAINCIVSLTYDRDVAGEDERAMDCYHELVNSCQARGYFPYRLGIAGMENGLPRTRHAELLNSIRETLDPKRILAPGRYER